MAQIKTLRDMLTEDVGKDENEEFDAINSQEISHGGIQCTKSRHGENDLIASKGFFELAHGRASNGALSAVTTLAHEIDRLQEMINICTLEAKAVAGCFSPGLCPATVAAHQSSTHLNLEKGYKSIAAALEEVKAKGTLLERMAVLEVRVLEMQNTLQSGQASRRRCWMDSQTIGKWLIAKFHILRKRIVAMSREIA